MSAKTAIDEFDTLLRTDPELRRVYLMMLAERRFEIIATAFKSAHSMEQLEHARGRVAMLDTLTKSHTREEHYGRQRSEHAVRSGESPDL